MASFPKPTLADWRALVDKDLGGASFEKALVYESSGLKIQPLYVEGPPRSSALLGVPHRTRICTRHERAATLAEDIAGGVDGVWLVPWNETEAAAMSSALSTFGGRVFREHDRNMVVTSGLYQCADTKPVDGSAADAVDEIALALSCGVSGLQGGVTQLSFRISVGRDTFVELCKLRALRICWRKVCVASGVDDDAIIHAVCSSRTLTERDAPTNMLRVTTELFAAILGGADWITPISFDAALGEPSEMARRIARNTALVLRDESQLDRVADPAGGSYFFETLTDELARAAWARFQRIQKIGGLRVYINSGELAKDLEAADLGRRARFRTRKDAIVGVSEFASMDDRPKVESPMPGRRDADELEQLRRTLESQNTKVTLVTLGAPAEYRARVAFASGLFAVGGVPASEGAAGEIVCLCGSDERYATEATDRARALKTSGTKRLYLAGRPGALEAALREAGVDEFIYLGCDVVAALAPIANVSRDRRHQPT